jgi:non-homologous end joining protein Ku
VGIPIPVAPQAIWSGSIAFGLVNAPVRMYGAIHEETIHFNLVHRKDRAPIGYEKVCGPHARATRGSRTSA